MLHLYRAVNQLSLDVAFGAMVCAAFFSHILHIQLQSNVLALLGLTVWVIYTTDHLLDVQKLKQRASSQRFRFYQQNFWKLIIAAENIKPSKQLSRHCVGDCSTGQKNS